MYILYVLYYNFCVTENSFLIESREIIPVYDYVHLLKGVRNNLLTKDLDTDITNKSINEIKYASWDHVILTYEIDKLCFMKRQLPKIMKKHVDPKLIPKMKVKYAAEIFSNTVSNFMDIVLKLSGGKARKI